MINGNADFGIILGGKNNTIENQSLNYSSSIPAPVNPGSHNFISNGEFNSIKANANHAAIIGGSNNTIATGAANAIVLGGSNITATEPNTVYMQKAAVTSLALPAYPSSGYRTLMVNAKGEFTASQIPTTLRSICNTPWCTNGNDGTIPGTDFLGTTDPQDLVIKTNNAERIRIMSNGYVGIGTKPNIISSTRNTSKDIDPKLPYKLDVLGNVRVLMGSGATSDNVVFKTGYSPTNEPVAQIGIGTDDPVRALHIITKHLNPSVAVPSCPTCLNGPP